MKIIINTEPYEWDKDTIEYGELVKLANKPSTVYYSVTYRMKHADGWKKDGILSVGQIIEVIEGTIFDIYFTGNA